MHYVARLGEGGAPTPPNYETHSRGYTRTACVDQAMGSAHMGAAISRLARGGVIRPHLHSFEESFYVLEGELHTELRDGRTFRLLPGMSYQVSDFGDAAHRSSTKTGAKLFIVD